jgi:16S rRNA processing protein RimM
LKYIAVGKITSAHGIKGYFKAIAYSGVIERYLTLKIIYLELKNEIKGFVIEDALIKDSYVHIKIQGIDNREEVKNFINKELFVPEDEKLELPENTFFIHDLIGLKVFDTEDNYIGSIQDVWTMGGNDIYQIVMDNREILMPAISEFVKEISLKRNRVTVKLIEGMID